MPGQVCLGRIVSHRPVRTMPGATLELGRWLQPWQATTTYPSQDSNLHPGYGPGLSRIPSCYSAALTFITTAAVKCSGIRQNNTCRTDALEVILSNCKIARGGGGGGGSGDASKFSTQINNIVVLRPCHHLLPLSPASSVIQFPSACPSLYFSNHNGITVGFGLDHPFYLSSGVPSFIPGP